MNKNKQILRNNNPGNNRMPVENPFQGFNPQIIINQVRNNPQILNSLNPKQQEMVKSIIGMYDNNDSEGLNNMANNIFKANGQDFNKYTQGLKQQLGFK